MMKIGELLSEKERLESVFEALPERGKERLEEIDRQIVGIGRLFNWDEAEEYMDNLEKYWLNHILCMEYMKTPHAINMDELYDDFVGFYGDISRAAFSGKIRKMSKLKVTKVRGASTLFQPGRCRDGMGGRDLTVDGRDFLLGLMGYYMLKRINSTIK